MPDWDISFFSHKCDYCGEKIKRKTKHIVIWGDEGGVGERYCDPHCMCMEYEAERKRQKERERLNNLRYGGDDE